MILNFKDIGSGFKLVNSSIEEKDLKSEDTEMFDYMDKYENEVALCFVSFIPDLNNFLKYEDKNIEYTAKEKHEGTYTVPELNIENKSFIEVLKAVYGYYKNKVKASGKKAS